MEIQHHIHKHPMIQYDLDKEKLPCRFCNTPCELPGNYCPKCECYLSLYCPAGCDDPINRVGSKIYACKEKDCIFYIHRSCADNWPQQIEHPFHPLHPLKLHYRSTDEEYICLYTCSACKRRRGLMAYHCSDCSFGLCLYCVKMNPPVKMEDGKHILYLFENTDFDRHCDVCDQTDSHTFIFICVVPKCGYAMHLHCSQLAFPRSTVYEYHNYHPLVLTNYVEEDGSDEYYCDACEYRRDPKHPVYYCKECNYAAHVYCGSSDVLPSLIAEYESDLKAKGHISDPFLGKIDEELALLRAKEEEANEKLQVLIQSLKTLEEERDRYVATVSRG